MQYNVLGVIVRLVCCFCLHVYASLTKSFPHDALLTDQSGKLFLTDQSGMRTI